MNNKKERKVPLSLAKLVETLHNLMYKYTVNSV